MKYVVSAENNSYFYWQLELLIESFLLHDKQNDLIILLAENNNPKNLNYCKNLPKYCKKIIHSDFASGLKYKNLNRIISLYDVSKNIEYPFTVIHSDMLLLNPIDSYLDDRHHIITNFSNKNLNVENYLHDKIENYNELNENVINFNFSMPIVFNSNLSAEMKDKFFAKLFLNYKEIYNDVSSNEKFPIEEIAWKKTFIDSFGHSLIGIRFLSCNIQDEIDSPFIHYNNGIVPHFHKKYFNFENIRMHQDPYEALIKYEDSNENTKYITKLIKSYRKRK